MQIKVESEGRFKLGLKLEKGILINSSQKVATIVLHILTTQHLDYRSLTS